MSLLLDLLSLGYFPKELPPGFSTTSFGAFAQSHPSPAFSLKNRSPKTCLFNLARTNGLRRRLGIPNPIPHLSLCQVIAQNEAAITAAIGKSILSVSKPVLDPQGQRARVPEYREGRLIDLRAERRVAARYLLRADVADFYPSIYTHAIPWAAHTRAIAKANKQCPALWGNEIDKWVRSSQDGQTMGIPIGPDTSFLIAELIMAGVEAEYRSHFPKRNRPNGLRFYDDIELAFETRDAAEAALPKLERALGRYELRLNPAKTSIEPLPRNLDEQWSAEIRSFEFRNDQTQQRLDIIRYFDLLFDLIRSGCSETVLAYALSRLDGDDLEHIDKDNQPMIQYLICQCIATHPSSIRFGVRQLLKLRERGFGLDSRLLKSTINLVIKAHAVLGHSSEVAWAIWSAMVFKTRIDASASKLISEVDDSVVAILAADAQKRGQIGKLTTSRWESELNADGLYGDHWLMAYEFERQGWLPGGITGYTQTDGNFKQLANAGVSFYTSFAEATSHVIPAPDPTDYK